MSAEVLEATLELRSFLFGAVYENEVSTAEFRKATGILGDSGNRVRERADEFLDPAVVARDGSDSATCDFIAGMTDRYARIAVRAPVHLRRRGSARRGVQGLKGSRARPGRRSEGRRVQRVCQV